MFSFSEHAKSGVGAALVLFLGANSAAAAVCPPGTFYIGLDDKEENYRCDEGLVIDPALFVMAWERPFLEGRIDELGLKRRRYQDQITALKRWSTSQDLYARDFAQIRRDVYFENAADALAIISAASKMFEAAKYLSPTTAQRIQQALSTATAGLHGAAAATSDAESERQSGHTASTILSLKDLISVDENKIPLEQQQAFKKTIDILYKLHQIPKRHFKGGTTGEFWNDARRDLDDLLDAGGVIFPQVNLPRGAGHIVAGQVVLWQIRKDRQAVNEASSKLLRAREYYEKRIAEMDKLLTFYKQRLNFILKR